MKSIVPLTVEQPFIKFQFEQAAVVQGKEAAVPSVAAAAATIDAALDTLPGVGVLLDSARTAVAVSGLTGEGIVVGVIDTGVNRDHPSLRGRVTDNLVYVNRNINDMSVDDKDGHGTAVAQAIAGTPFGAWPGGVAQGVSIVSAGLRPA